MRDSRRAPRQIFNEKSLCALGNGVATTGKLPKAGIDKALAALRRFRTISEILQVEELHVLATAAARDASNGAEILAAASLAIGAPISLLSGAARSRAFRAWRRFRDLSARWHCRRSRRRLARADRRQGRAAWQGHDPAAWRPDLDGRIQQFAARGGQNRPGRSGRARASSSASPVAPSMPSAEPGARSPNCICASAITR